MQSNIKKTLIAIFVIIIFTILYQIALFPVGETRRSFFGSVSALIVNPDNKIIYRLVKDVLTWASICVLIPVYTNKLNVASFLGLSKGFIKSVAVASLCILPMMIGNLIYGSFCFSTEVFLRNVILAGFTEEVVFRGFIFGTLYKFCKIGFIWSSLIVAVLFSLGHLYQGNDLLSSLMVLLVTGTGSLFFCYLYIKWETLWMPILFHTFMNGIWSLIPITDVTTSTGNLSANIGRGIAIILAIVITIHYRKNIKISLIKNK